MAAKIIGRKTNGVLLMGALPTIVRLEGNSSTKNIDEGMAFFRLEQFISSKDILINLNSSPWV